MWGLTFGAALTASLLIPAVLRGAQPPTRTLTVVVVDQTDAAIVGARVSLVLALAQGEARTVGEGQTDGRGEVVFSHLAADGVIVRVESPGFETHVSASIAPRRSTVHRVRLRLAGYVEEITVRRDPRDVRADRRGDAFSMVLTPEQLAALSDDPATMQRQLEQMAGPGAVFRVDGFRGGRFPTKQEIARIRIVWNVFSAEFHDGGTPMVDITTKPGADRFHVNVLTGLQLSGLAAAPFFGTAQDAPSSQNVAVGMGGPLVPQRASLNVYAQRTGRREPAEVVAAGTASGGNALGKAPPSRETDGWDLVARLSMTAWGRVIRGSLEHRWHGGKNLGIGGLDLPERAYSRMDRRTSVSVSSTGSLGQHVVLDTRARIQTGNTALDPVSRLPAVVVNGASRRGGAQVEGGRRPRELEVAQDVDIPWRQHAFRSGFLIERFAATSDEWSNKLGTFTFSSLEAFSAGTPSLLTQRTGNPRVDVATTQVGAYLQDDFRVAPGVSVSLGLRQESQTSIGGNWNLSPRAGVSWSPFAGGRTTFTAAFGRYYTWTALSSMEMVARLDGRHQRELIVLDPGYPDPFARGERLSPPSNRYQLAPDLVLPLAWQGSLSVQRELAPGLTARAVYQRTIGNRLQRGRNLNAPDSNGIRPEPEWGNVVQMESTARSRSSALRLSLIGRLPVIPVTLVSNYSHARSYDDTDGPFDLPADPARPDAEWARSSGNVAHQAVIGAFAAWRSRLHLVFMMTGTSGLPYTVTTGDDDNGDSVFNDRPPGIGRNPGRQAATFSAQVRVAWSIPLRRGTTSVELRPGPQAKGGPAAPAATAPRVQVYLEVLNALNNPGWSGYVGALSSPLFGQPTASQQARRLAFGASFYF